MDSEIADPIQAAWSVYSAKSLAFLGELPVRNRASLLEATNAVLNAVDSGNLVYAAGAGHSVGAVIETFFRAGGLPFVYPLWHPRVFPLNGAADSTAAEREEGLGAEVVSESPIGVGDVLFVFSNSGINFYPVEIARAGREAGATVVAVTSLSATTSSPVRAGERLADIADIVLDTGVPPGDVSWPEEAPVIAPLSSLAAAQLWNLLMVSLKAARPGLPTWRSANVAGDGGNNTELSAAYAGRIPAM